MKRWRRTQTGVVLEPANETFAPIEVEGDVTVLGKVVELRRDYEAE